MDRGMGEIKTFDNWNPKRLSPVNYFAARSAIRFRKMAAGRTAPFHVISFLSRPSAANLQTVGRSGYHPTLIGKSTSWSV
jgi:hypothetical protein